MKCLIINGSPKNNGNTARIVEEFKKYYSGEIDEVNVFKNVSPCIDCLGCTKVAKCCINDDFAKVIADDYETVVIASPIYMSNLPGPMFNLINRFNYLYNNRVYLKVKQSFKPKKAVLLLVGGGFACESLKGELNESHPIDQAKYIFKKLNANLKKQDTVLCLNTDETKVEDNNDILRKVAKIASSCNVSNNVEK